MANATEVRTITTPSGKRLAIGRTTRVCPVTHAESHTFKETFQFGEKHEAGYFGGDPSRVKPADTESWDETPGEQFARVVDPIAGGLSVWPVPAAAAAIVESEIAELRALGFNTAADAVREKHPVSPRVVDATAAFDVGDVQVHRSVLKIPGAFLQLAVLIARHAHGDHGELGTSADVKPSDDALWCPAAFGLLTENAVAIQTGSGLVTSRFPMFTDEHRRADLLSKGINPDAMTNMQGLTAFGEQIAAPKMHAQRIPLPEEGIPSPDDRIDVLTLLIPGQESRTVVYSVRHRLTG